MNIDIYFPDAIAFEEMLHQLYSGDDADLTTEEKKQLSSRLLESRYLQKIKENQSLNEWREGAVFAPSTINKLKKDFFFNISITSTHARDNGKGNMAYHRHNYLEIIYVAEGSYHQTINGADYEHKKGEICLMNPNVLHKDWISSPGNRALFICLGQNYVSKELVQVFAPHKELRHFLEYQLGSSSVQYVVFQPKRGKALQEVMKQLLTENLEKQPGHHTVIKGLLVRLFYYLIAEGEHFVCSQTKKEIEDRLIAEITEYMQKHLADGSRSETAGYFHFNPDYLNRLLVNSLGKTYSEHLKELRLKEAARMLETTQNSVNHIIRELGFSNKGYFNRIFKECYGVLPGAYRKQM